MSSLGIFLVICHLRTGSSLKIALGDDAAGGVGQGEGSAFSEEKIQALASVAAATHAAASPATDGQLIERDVQTLGGNAAKLAVRTEIAAVFGTQDEVVTTTGAGAMTATMPAAAAAAVKAASPNNAAGVACARYAFECASPSIAMDVGVGCEVECVTAAGAGELVAVANLPAGGLISATMAKGAGVAQTGAIVEYFDPVDSSTSEFGITVTGQTATEISFTTDHATDFKAGNPFSSGGGGVYGDPKVSNLRGEKFEILAMGTFSLLSITGKNSLETRLSLDATVDRAGEMCGATYIKNATMSGSWVNEVAKVKDVRVQAVPDTPKSRSLQVAFDEHWYGASKVKDLNPIIAKSTHRFVEFSLKDVSIKVSIDAHRVRQNGKKTSQYANFLNVDVKGVQNVDADGVRLGGLLGYDDHNFATQVPNDCKRGNLANLKQVLTDSSDRQSRLDALFLSNVDVN